MCCELWKILAQHDNTTFHWNQQTMPECWQAVGGRDDANPESLESMVARLGWPEEMEQVDNEGGFWENGELLEQIFEDQNACPICCRLGEIRNQSGEGYRECPECDGTGLANPRLRKRVRGSGR
jgi:hypothetical protein